MTEGVDTGARRGRLIGGLLALALLGSVAAVLNRPDGSETRRPTTPASKTSLPSPEEPPPMPTSAPQEVPPPTPTRALVLPLIASVESAVAEQQAYAKGTGQELTYENRLGMKFVLVPPGRFVMGSPDDEKGRDGGEDGEGPQHPVGITRGLYFGVTEVTNGQYRTFKPDHETPPFLRVDLNGDDQPVAFVSWEDAQAFCVWLTEREGRKARLPTEAEWEYACRAGTAGPHYWGEDDGATGQYANVADSAGKKVFPEWARVCETDDGYAGSAPVGHYKPNAFGLHDMIGNVREWCADGSRIYKFEPATDPVGPASNTRVLRGGSWAKEPAGCRAATRCDAPHNHKFIDWGFRVVVAEKTR
jgi:formylglycine-generating enzyme required for sulfatase activity